MHYCCIVLCADDSFYVGIAEEPQERVRDHNSGKGADWTAARLPVKLVWSEPHPTPGAGKGAKALAKGCK